MENNTTQTQEMEQNDAAVTLTAGITLAATAGLFVDSAIKASALAVPSLPAEGVMFLAGLLLVSTGGMTLSYAARQHTLLKAAEAKKKAEAAETATMPAVQQEDSAVTA